MLLARVRPLLALLPLVLASCYFYDSGTAKYLIRVENRGDAGSPAPTDISVIAGSDKFWWPTIASGDSQSVTLATNRNSLLDVTLAYSFQQRDRIWESGPLSQQDDYRFILTIDGSGGVTANGCRLPC